MVSTLSSAAPGAATVAYREWAPPAALAPWVRRVWELTVAGADGPGRILPDGCMDVVAMDGALLVAGPDTGPVPIARRAGETVIGVRFHPGAGPAVLGPRASELRDVRVPLEAVWGRDGRELEERVAAAPPAEGLAMLRARLLARLGAAPLPTRWWRPRSTCWRAIPTCPAGSAGSGRARPGRAAAPAPLPRRRRLRAQDPCPGPAVPAAARAADRPGSDLPGGARGRPSLALAAADAGYADQAHMTTECTRLAGVPPTALLAERHPTGRSDLLVTPATG
jgi:AraC-like DNA-binding protein